jgi:predicted O-linked N-acetylglucosamine transferase (SPINDLY family)
VALAHDLPRLRTLREGLRERVMASPLMDAPRFAGHFVQALHEMWAAREQS